MAILQTIKLNENYIVWSVMLYSVMVVQTGFSQDLLVVQVQPEQVEVYSEQSGIHCICIETRGGIYGEFKDIKLCKVKIKSISLCWYLVTMIFWCQTNLEIHYSPAMHKVQDKTNNLLYKLVKESWKLTIVGSFMITCVCTCIYLKIKLWAIF